MSPALAATARALLWLCVAAMCLLTFAWPFVVSPDPAQPHFKPVAIATLCGFLAAMAILLVDKACRAPRT
jgi:hypothetical protein